MKAGEERFLFPGLRLKNDLGILGEPYQNVIQEGNPERLHGQNHGQSKTQADQKDHSGLSASGRGFQKMLFLKGTADLFGAYPVQFLVHWASGTEMGVFFQHLFQRLLAKLRLGDHQNFIQYR